MHQSVPLLAIQPACLQILHHNAGIHYRHNEMDFIDFNNETIIAA